MIITPRIRNNICINAHPTGCAEQIRSQIRYVRHRPPINSPARVLVVGASNGYGLAARIVSAFGSGAATIGVSYERPGTGNRTATAGWYNTRAFETQARQEGLNAWSINGDAFSDAVKQEVGALIKAKVGRIDMLVYSIAAPRRIDPQSGEIYTSVIKPIGRPFSATTVDFLTGAVRRMTAQPATESEIAQTIKVMGGEDWLRWVRMLRANSLLETGFRTLAFSYIGSPQTRPLYRDGTIGAAKKDLEQKSLEINRLLSPLNGSAVISVNKALITRASAVIPAVPLYIALLYRVMKAKKLHEGCIQQMDRLYRDFLFSDAPPPPDEKGRIRLDDREMRPDVQEEVARLWDRIDARNVTRLADIEGMQSEFLRHHGFGMVGVDYGEEVPRNLL